MATTDIDIINAALTRTGNNPISALTNDALGARIASQNYEKLVRREISAGRYKWATKHVVLSLLDPVVHGDAPRPWLNSYQAPADMLDLRSIKADAMDGLPIRYELQSKTIFAVEGIETDLIASYLYRVPEADLPEMFVEGIIRRLEAMFQRGIKERDDVAKDRDKDADAAFGEARRLDAQSTPPREVTSSPTLEARVA